MTALSSLEPAFLHCGVHLSSPCSRSDPLLPRQGAALAHLDFLPLMIWYSGQTALFLFLLARATPAYLPTALSATLRPLFPFQQTQVIPLKPATFCTLFTDLRNTNKFATSLLFSSYLTLVLFLLPCPLLHLSFYLKLSGRFDRNCLSLLLFYQATMGPWALVSPHKRRG